MMRKYVTETQVNVLDNFEAMFHTSGNILDNFKPMFKTSAKDRNEMKAIKERNQCLKSANTPNDRG